MSALQIAGTLLAIPVGIGSAYTMYRANFTVDATCQSLRSNIITMLDKSVDATARHILVRHDVEAFEQNCSGVDPDATAAFKALLAAEKKAPAATVTAKPAEARPEPVARKAEPHPAVAVKQTPAVAPAAKADAAATARDPSSDAVWIAAVRQALVTHTAEPKSADEPKPAAELPKAAALTPAPSIEPAKAAPIVMTPPAATPVARDIRPLTETPAPATPPVSLAPPAPEQAPALPPATAVAIAPAPPKDDGHPVPPEVIPDSIAVAPAKTEAHTRSRLGELAAKIPLVGWAINR